MKRVFQSIAVAIMAFAAWSCTSEALAPAEPSTTPGAVPTIAVNIVSKTDDGFSFKVTPSGNVGFYTCFVSDSKIDSPAADQVYSLKYKNIMAKRLVYADNNSFTGAVSGLDFNTNYYVYAVAANPEGNLGEVASAVVLTTDTVAPSIVVDADGDIDYEFEENTVLLTFSEPVSYVESKKITANVFAYYYLTGSPVMTDTPATVEVEGNEALLTFEKIETPGSFYVVNIPEGAFVDALGQPTPAVSSRFFQDGEDVNVEGIYGYLENANLEVTLPETTAIDDLSQWIKVGVPTMVNSIDPKAKFTTVIKHVESTKDGVSSVTTTTYPMEPITHFGGELYNILVRPAGTPSPKDEITITIPAEACEDIYGNTNEEDIVLGPFVYAYTAVYPKEGNYIVNNVVEGQPAPFAVKLTKLDDEHYSFAADWFGFFGGGFGNPVLYLTLDEPARTLTCDDQFILKGAVTEELWGSGFYYYDEAGTMVLTFWGGGDYGTDPIVINYDDEGNLTTISYCEYGVSDAQSGKYLGTAAYCADGTTISPAAAAGSVKGSSSMKFAPIFTQTGKHVKTSR